MGQSPPPSDAARRSRFELVVLIGSLGGLHAASTVLTGLPRNFPVPVLLLLHGRHIPAQPQILAPLLQRATTLPVRTASAGMSLADLGVTVLPYGSTATLDRNLQLQPVPASRTGGGDALLAAAAGARGAAVIGVILTGLLRDGAHGVRAVKRGGGRVLAEDPRTARAASMPAAAIASGCVDFVLPVHRIATALVALAMAPGGADLFAVPTPAWASR